MKLFFTIFPFLASSVLAGNQLSANKELSINDQLTTINGRQNLILQPDGNLVMYWNKVPIWATGTVNSGATVAKMQPDGNFVLYNAQNQAKWATGTNGYQGATLVLQDDGNLVIYDSQGSPRWSSDTVKNRMNANDAMEINMRITTKNGCQYLLLQPDGNLVMYWNGIARWATGTDNSGVTVAKMQPDGNFVLYNAQNQAKWATGTNGNSGAYLILQDDGNLVVYDSNGSPKWSSNTKKGSDPHYGDFNGDLQCCKGDDGRGNGVRQYAAILWGISGDWDRACKNTPFSLNGHSFCQASSCMQYASHQYGAVLIPETRCNIDQNWLMSELRRVVGRNFVCDWTNWASDGCSNPLQDALTYAYNDMFYKACVFHDYCYASPWNGDSSGKQKCDDRFYSLMFEVIPWWNIPAMLAADIYADGIKGSNGQNAFNNGQNAIYTKNRVSCHNV